MKPAKFDYYDPATVDEAAALLREYGDDAKVLAGGQSLMPLLNMRLARPKVVVDVNRIAGGASVQAWGDGVSVGLTTRQRALQRDALISRRVPVLGEAASYIGHPQIRSRGTICGSLAHADPAAELPAMAVVLDAELVAAGPSGRRSIPAEQFFVHYLTTSLRPTELLVEARFPAPPAGMAWSVMEVSRRHGDFALVGVVAGLIFDRGRNVISDARLAYFGVHPTPRRARDAEKALIGQKPGDDAYRAAGELAAGGLDPDTDIHATVEYRKSVSAALTVRALREAFTKAGAV